MINMDDAVDTEFHGFLPPGHVDSAANAYQRAIPWYGHTGLGTIEIIGNPEGMADWDKDAFITFARKYTMIPTGTTLSWRMPYSLLGYLRIPDEQGQWAAQVGLDRNHFEGLLKDPSLEQLLVQSKKEGIVNKVDATPTFFINGRKYFGSMDIDEMIDVVIEEYDRISGKVYQ